MEWYRTKFIKTGSFGPVKHAMVRSRSRCVVLVVVVLVLRVVFLSSLVVISCVITSSSPKNT